MDGIFFLASVLGVVLIMWWTIQNDAAALDGDTKGIFAMR